MDLKNTLEYEILQKIDYFQQFSRNNVVTAGEAFTFLRCEAPVLICNLIREVEKYSSIRQLSNKQHFSLITYLMRFPSLYKLFEMVYTKRSLPDESIIEMQSHLRQQLLSLLEKSADVIFNCPADETVGTFLNLMDCALDKIGEINISLGLENAELNLNNAFGVVEEILCLSMSVAQVSYGDDNKIISAGCRSVLNSIESIRTEINKETPNIAMCNLVVDSCSDTLCMFEAKVNTTVLRLCLNTFSDYKLHLNNLFTACLNCDTSTISNDAIELLVIDFDIQMDRIFQIALFSVASSAIGNSVAEIKNIIANLEFLESEVVPSFMALAKNHSPSRLAVANMLKEVWKKQVQGLRKAVHGVIEPSAYCKLVYEELNTKSEELYEMMKSPENAVPKVTLEMFLNYTSELGVMTTTCMTCFDKEMQPKIKKQLQMVYNVMNELDAAYKMLSSKDSTKMTNQRIYKRCKILLAVIKQLWLVMLENNDKCNVSDVEKDLRQPLLQPGNTDCDDPISKIISRGKQILKDRSMCQINVTAKEVCREHLFIKDKSNLLSSVKKSTIRKHGYRNISIIEDYNDMSTIAQLIPQLEKLKI